LEEIVKSASRARDLVRQLLALSRKQTLEFQRIDLNVLLRKFETLLRSLIREDIAINMVLDQSLPLIDGDPGQIEQVIMNLAVNAQDAMPNGGTLTIETTQVGPDENELTEHADMLPAPYLRLLFADTGCGMDAEIQEHLFEPFFTTKDKDKGTGLGLATVYGTVKQHGGHIRADSEPDRGTTFKIYLPPSTRSPAAGQKASGTPSERRGREIVLLVEDNEQVRNLACSMLEHQGYRVLAASSGKEALSILDRHAGPVNLLLTNVIMPGMNGRQLFERVSGLYPDVKVLYMSGYAHDVITQSGVVDVGLHFIQKPFSGRALTEKLRTVLDG